MKKLLIILVIILCVGGIALAETVTLTWNAITDSSLTGFKIYLVEQGNDANKTMLTSVGKGYPVSSSDKTSVDITQGENESRIAATECAVFVLGD